MKSRNVLETVWNWLTCKDKINMESVVYLQAPVDVYELLKEKDITKTQYEIFFVFILDKDRSLLSSFCHTDKHPTQVYMPTTRQVLEMCAEFHSTNIILAHNHLTGSGVPSLEDVDNTLDLIKNLNPYGIEILDHVVVTPSAYYSMFEHNLF